MIRQRLGLHPTVLLMAGAHFMVDGYGNIYAPLLPLLIPRLGLSLAAAGTLTMLFQIAASVSQVGFGRLADGWRPRLLVVCGPVIAVLVLSLVGLATTKTMLAIILFVGGLGGAAFHPPAAALAHRLGGDRPGSAMSVHITGGTLGFSMGPLVFAPFAERFGLEWTPLLAIPGLLVIALFLRRVPPFPHVHGQRRLHRRAASLRAATDAAVPDCRLAHADVALLRDVRAGDDDAPRAVASARPASRSPGTSSPAASAASSAARPPIASARGG